MGTSCSQVNDQQTFDVTACLDPGAPPEMSYLSEITGTVQPWHEVTAPMALSDCVSDGLVSDSTQSNHDLPMDPLHLPEFSISSVQNSTGEIQHLHCGQFEQVPEIAALDFNLTATVGQDCNEGPPNIASTFSSMSSLLAEFPPLDPQSPVEMSCQTEEELMEQLLEAVDDLASFVQPALHADGAGDSKQMLATSSTQDSLLTAYQDCALGRYNTTDQTKPLPYESAHSHEPYNVQLGAHDVVLASIGNDADKMDELFPAAGDTDAALEGLEPKDDSFFQLLLLPQSEGLTGTAEILRTEQREAGETADRSLTCTEGSADICFLPNTVDGKETGPTNLGDMSFVNLLGASSEDDDDITDESSDDAADDNADKENDVVSSQAKMFPLKSRLPSFQTAFLANNLSKSVSFSLN
ncbi:hypothetical protein BaRGS_00015455 [Batillaria attramentaria]|uniref:Uncharacterized protein n=1 Tax=Batillaria attramentaria TaxID=370345 RepID=A0ABD0L2J4_9CAEN